MSKAAILFNLNLGVALSEALNSELWITPYINYITLHYVCMKLISVEEGLLVSGAGKVV